MLPMPGKPVQKLLKGEEAFRRIITSKSTVKSCEGWKTMWNFPSSLDTRFSFPRDVDIIQRENFTKIVAHLDYRV